ncbi:apoptosis-stimulating of p53 protein 2 isoform X3 [Kryptolebias marmoratus]|nr:apoptosis-stimulating of p53 protein 2 isoform X3 [Kryptolebias marmoratus]XP_037831975.1 apoptosis-stimulating of p53 protein 2 isoform X3 [Kryptolebias marmoratus]XP_037831976.1 apoptosis-stimulating of p53 protein 2 isoform X3 [Kryptolebias marmoratus]XP_037831977.1 apoptosis-stimulating of p53 protein 2 isoform X3 [Kryptolebias marmoratus]
MFLTVYLSNNDQHFSEVPIMPETMCRDVMELCKEPGEVDCYLAEMWRGSERVVEEEEGMLEVLQRWGQQRGEVRYILRHLRAPGRESDGFRAADPMIKRKQVKSSVERSLDNGVSAPCLDATLRELQDLASRQQQQISAQQHLLASKEQQLCYLQLQDQRQQQHQEVTGQERLRQLQENAHNQEAKLRRVRALRGQVEQKRLSNSKLVEEIDQMTNLFHQKQRELLMAAARVEELSDQLQALRSSRLQPPLPPHQHNTSSTDELEHLYRELQLRNKLNQDQSTRLQQQKDCLNKRNLEVAAMDQRLIELRQRLWKKKAALQQKENLPVASDSITHQHGVSSRVAAVGPYIQSSSTSGSQGPPAQDRQEMMVKPAYPDGTATLPMPDSSLKPPPRPAKPASDFHTSKISKISDWSSLYPESSGGSCHASTLPRMANLSCHSSAQGVPDLPPADLWRQTPALCDSAQDQASGETLKDQKGLSELDFPPPLPSRFGHTTENLLRGNQASGKSLSKTVMPPPVPSKSKSLSSPGPSTFSKPSYNTGTFPGKIRPVGGYLKAPGVLSIHSNTLPLPSKQENPPAATVRPYTPDLSDGPAHVLQKPQTLAGSSIYSMYTQQATPGKCYQPGQGTLPRSMPPVYGKPVPASGGQQTVSSHNTAMNSGFCGSDANEAGNNLPSTGVGVDGDATERATPRPLSPTKLLPFLSNPHRNPSDADLEAVRRRLHPVPRPLKKRSSITEPEGPSGPNILKLLYQKTTLAAMETIPMETVSAAETYVQEDRTDVSSKNKDSCRTGLMQQSSESPSNSETPPPLLPHAPIPDPGSYCSLPPPPEDKEEEKECLSTIAHLNHFPEEFPPYPPPPYPSSGETEQGDDVLNLQPPEITGQVSVPPGKRSILRKTGSDRKDHGNRVQFSPLALLLDSSLEGEYDLVQRVIYDVDDPSMPNDEGITALHNAVCAGHTEIVKFLVQFGVNVNAADSDGWTPLHCAASCNNVQLCKFLVECGAAVFATTYSDMQTAADKCEEMEEGYAQCSQFLYGVQEKMGVMNRGVVYSLWDYEPQRDDEVGFSEGDCMTVLRREDDVETEWWWARCADQEGYIPRNLLGLYLRIKPRQRSLA